MSGRVVPLHADRTPDPAAEIDQVLEASDAVAYAGEAVARAAAASVVLVEDLRESRLALRDLNFERVALADRDPGRLAPRRSGRGVCRVCGCDDLHACALGCRWADATHTLCSTCAIVPARIARDPELVAVLEGGAS